MSRKAHGLRRPVIFGLVGGMLFWAGCLAEAGTFEVKVVEKESGKAIAGAEIVASPAGSYGASAVGATSGADGLAQITITDPSGKVRIGVKKEGWCPLRWDLSAQDLAARKSLEFRMGPAMTIGGVVRDDLGKPVPGVQIAINFPQGLSGPRTPLDDLAVTSGPDGKWQAAYVPVDADLIRVDVSRPGYKWDEQQPSHADLIGQKAVLNVHTLNQITGRVIGPDGHPVTGATVYKGEQWGIMAHNQRTLETTTDAEGHFQFPSGDGGKLQLAAVADAYGPVLTDYDAASGTPPIDLVLTQPHTLKVRVTDLDGNPIAGLAVQADAWRSFRYPPWKFTTDAEGRFTFTNAPAEKVSMDFHASGKMAMIMYPLQPGDTENLVRLGPELRLHGQVLDAATGAPVASFSITPGYPKQVFQNGALTNTGGEFPSMGRDRTFRNGNYDWTFTQPMIVGTEKPYDFVLRAQADGYAPTISRIFDATEGDAEYDFHMKPATFTTGVVRLPDGSPAGGAEIYLVDETWNVEALNGVPHPRQMLRAATTISADKDGRFKFLDGAVPPVMVVWHDAGFAILQTADLRLTPEIKLTGWARIEGTIKRGQTIAANEQVALWYPEQWEEYQGGTPQKPAKAYRQRQAVFYQYNTRADANGHFSFDRVAPGEVAIARVEDVPRPMGFGTPIQTVWGGCRLAVVRALEGTTTNVTVGGIGQTVTGRFISTNKFAGCLVTLSVELPEVPYPSGLTGEAREKWAQDWFWSDAGAPWRIWFGGTPQTQGGSWGFQRGFPGTTANGGSWAVKVESDGTFRIDDVPAGDYTLVAIFYTPTVPGDNFARPAELSRMSTHFTVPAADNLPARPPLDLGDIDQKQAHKPSTRSDLSVPAPTPSEPVKAGMGASRSELTAGDSFEVMVEIRIAGGYHIYAATAPNDPFIPASLELTLPPGFRADGDWVRPTATVARDGAMIYTDSVRFRRSLKVQPDAPPGKFAINTKLKYQACNAELCFPPATIGLEAALTVAGAITKEQP